MDPVDFHSGALAAQLDRSSIDEELDYVFTLKMAPTPVRLRLLAAAGSDRQYLAVKFR